MKVFVWKCIIFLSNFEATFFMFVAVVNFDKPRVMRLFL